LDPQSVGRWDVCVSPPLEVAEAKLAPTRTDLTDWLERVGRSCNVDPETRFLLAYGSMGGAFLSSISSLQRLAIEASDESPRFQVLAEKQRIRDAAEVLGLLGNGAPA